MIQKQSVAQRVEALMPPHDAAKMVPAPTAQAEPSDCAALVNAAKSFSALACYVFDQMEVDIDETTVKFKGSGGVTKELNMGAVKRELDAALARHTGEGETA